MKWKMTTLEGDPVRHEDATLVVRFGSQLSVRVVPAFFAELWEPEWEYSVRLLLGMSTSRAQYLVRGVSVGLSAPLVGATDESPSAPLQEISSAFLRTIKVGELHRIAAAGGIYMDPFDHGGPMSFLDLFGADGGFGFPSGFMHQTMNDSIEKDPSGKSLGLVALTYQLAHVRSQPPVKAVEAQFGLIPRTAARWIARAKELGMLETPTVVNREED